MTPMPERWRGSWRTWKLGRVRSGPLHRRVSGQKSHHQTCPEWTRLWPDTSSWPDTTSSPASSANWTQTWSPNLQPSTIIIIITVEVSLWKRGPEEKSFLSCPTTKVTRLNHVSMAATWHSRPPRPVSTRQDKQWLWRLTKPFLQQPPKVGQTIPKKTCCAYDKMTRHFFLTL